MTTPFRLVDIEGEPFDRGCSYGTQTRDLILKAIEFYKGIFAQTGMTWAEVKQAGKIYAERLKGISEPLFQEMEGIAKGAGLELGEIVALNARTELRYGGDANKDLLSGEGCTGAIAIDTAVKNGRVIHGQNWDWLSECAEFSIILRIKQNNGPTILTLVEAGTLARCGLNSEGVAITGNFLKIKDDHRGSGVPAPIFRREVLSSSTIRDAISVVLNSRRSSSINLMVSDASGMAFNFETTPDRIFPIHAENDILVHANHFESPAAINRYEDVGLQVTPDSLYRGVLVRKRLEQSSGNLRLQDFADAFSDKRGHPYGVCKYPSAGPGGSLSCTVATVIMDTQAGVLYVAKSPYNSCDFWRYDLTCEAPSPVTNFDW